MSNEQHHNFVDEYRGWHTKISFIKSGVRLGASAGAVFALWYTNGHTQGVVAAILAMSIGYAIAEFWGIVEEWI